MGHALSVIWSVLLLLLICGTVFVIMSSNSDSGKKVSWILVVTLLPAVGIVLYVVFGLDMRNPSWFLKKHRKFFETFERNADAGTKALLFGRETERKIREDYRELSRLLTNGNGTILNGYIVKPSSFDPSHKYPVVLNQYSGPGSQQVLDKWEIDWYHYLAEQGYIVICVDGRGTGGRGKAFETTVYQQLGRYETQDQIAAARYAASLPYVDADKIGIWGWSYGGYETLMAMTTGGGVFAAGIAIAPVTDWRYYDTIYAERYMRTPNENTEGYRYGAPVTHAAGLQGDLLIITGTADDNVHMSNTMEFTAALIEAGKQFDMMVYPNQGHSINGGNSRYHIYTRVCKFFNEKLK